MLAKYLWSSNHDQIVRLSPLARIIFYGLIGWCIEVVFTAIVDHIELELGHLKLMGYTYIWMFPIWGTAFYAAELESKEMQARGWPFYLRWIVYMTTSWVWEYSCGYALRYFTGHCPWDYSKADSNIDGIIRLDYGICWICTGTLAEWMHPFLDSITLIVPSPMKKVSRRREPIAEENKAA